MWKSLLQMDSNSLVNKRKKKKNEQTNKGKYIYNEDWVARLNCKIEFFVPCDGHQNCFNKSVLTTLDLFWCVWGLSSKLKSLWPLLIGRVQLPQPQWLGRDRLFLLVWFSSEKWKADSALQSPSAFEPGNSGLGIWRPNH